MKIFNIIRFIFIIILINFLQIGSLLVTMGKTTTETLSYILYIFCAIAILLYALFKLIGKKRINIYDILIIALTICAIISVIYAYDTNTALYGAATRYEGLYALLSYYSFFLLATTIEKKHQKIIMHIVIFYGILQIAIGTIQYLKIMNIFGYDRSYNWSTRFTSAIGTLSNPNFYSTYILICLLYVLGNFFSAKKIITKILYSILIGLFAYGLILGNTMSSMIIATFIIIITSLCYLRLKHIKQNIIPTAILLIFGITSIFLLNKYTNNELYYRFVNSKYDIVEIFKNGLQDSTAHHRIYIWKETLKKVPEYIYTGIGIDNFGYIDNGIPMAAVTQYNILYFDKVHNDYLQILITEGIFALIFYLILLLIVLISAIKNIKKEGKLGLTLAFVGYAIQLFIVFSVIIVAPYFYLIMGFIVSNKKTTSPDEIYELKNT